MSKIRMRYVVAGAAVVAIVVAVLASGVLNSSSKGGGGNGADNGAPTSLATVKRRSLSEQTQVSATLGYADPATIVVSGGTSPSTLLQAQQALSSAGSQLAGAKATASADSATLAEANAVLSADRQKLAIDCAGDNAGGSASSSPSDSGSGGGATPCATDVQAVASDGQAVSQAKAKVTADRQSVAAATTSVGNAQTALAQASSSATIDDQSSTYTELPTPGQIVGRGDTLFEISGEPVVLMYGSIAAWRAFTPGMSPGSDVVELNANLSALGYGAPTGDAFTGATAAAIDAFQSARGLPATGELLLGSVVFEPGAVRVTTVTPTIGSTVQAGAVLGVTSTRREVTIALDAAQQSEIKLGDAVTITLPDNSTTPGRVTYVGKVATTPSSGGADNGGSSTPTIEVDVTPSNPAATGHLDQAPVNVSIITASVKNVLVVPVNALLALASGGYAVEEVAAGGTRQLVAVELGLFDDADGLVQVTGSAIAAGQRVVVPSE